MKIGIAPGTSDVSLELIAASLEVEIKVMAEICQKVLMELECWLLVINMN